MSDPLWSSTVPVMQNRVYDSRAAAMQCRLGPLVLVSDTRSGLVYNARFDPNLLEYNQGYNNEQSLSAVFQQHLEKVLGLVIRHVPPKGRVVEVGCGKGTFLHLLRRNGVDANGCDPAYEGDEPYIQKRFFGKDADLQADVVILRHVLEHIPNPYAFIREIAAANDGRGLLYLEVPDLNWIVQNRAFYDLFYEHCNYFTCASLQAAFKSVVASGWLFGSQYLWLTANLADVAAEPSGRSALPDLSVIKHELSNLVTKLSAFPRRFVWGAGAKGTTLAYLFQGTAAEIDYLIDINPRKQGCFSPVSGTPIISPNAAQSLLGPGDLVLVMNPNYRYEIESSLPSGVCSMTVTDGVRCGDSHSIES